MAWPTGSVSTTNLDANTDSALSARPDLKTMADKVNDMIAARAAADGVASLDAGGKIPDGQIRAYSDSHTTASLASQASETINIWHGLGTDDVIADIVGLCAASEGDWTAVAMRPDGKHSSAHGPTSALNFVLPSQPSTGYVAIRIRNVNASSSTVSIDYRIRPL